MCADNPFSDILGSSVTMKLGAKSPYSIQFLALGYKTFFMLNYTEHENFPAHKC